MQKAIKSKSFWMRLKLDVVNNPLLYIMIAPVIGYVALFCYGPMYGVQIAFKNYQPTRTIAESDWVGLKYFIKFFSGAKFWPVMKNTLLIGLYSIATFPCSLIFALLINELNNSKFIYTSLHSQKAQSLSRVSLCNPMDCSPPGSSVHGILQEWRIPYWSG